MANPARGEVALKVGDLDYTLKFSTNAICELEDHLNRGLNEIVSDLERLSVVRALLWAGLRSNHPELTLKMAGDIIDKCGMPAAVDHVGTALRLAFPPETGSPNG